MNFRNLKFKIELDGGYWHDGHTAIYGIEQYNFSNMSTVALTYYDNEDEFGVVFSTKPPATRYKARILATLKLLYI